MCKIDYFVHRTSVLAAFESPIGDAGRNGGDDNDGGDEHNDEVRCRHAQALPWRDARVQRQIVQGRLRQSWVL